MSEMWYWDRVFWWKPRLYDFWCQVALCASLQHASQFMDTDEWVYRVELDPRWDFGERWRG